MVYLHVNVTDVIDNPKRFAPNSFSLLDRLNLEFYDDPSYDSNLCFVQTIVRELQNELHHLIDLIFIKKFARLLKGIHTSDVWDDNTDLMVYSSINTSK